MGYQGYRDLKVYQKAYYLAREIFERSKHFPQEERYALTDQIRRSSRSIASNIAEAWMKRRYKKYFITKIIDCCGEAGETEVWLDIARDAKYLTLDEHAKYFDGYQEINRMLNGMIDKADKFCLTRN